MVARFWSARTTRERAPQYLDHFRHDVLPRIREVDGYVGGMVLEREHVDEVEVVVMTFWRSRDAIRRFAGDDIEAAVVADDAAALLTEFDKRVRHYGVVVKD
jgi:heme-degrading monooxygenase HmoA